MNQEAIKQEKARLNRRKDLLKQQKAKTISNIKKNELDLKKKELRIKEKELSENKYISTFEKFIRNC